MRTTRVGNAPDTPAQPHDLIKIIIVTYNSQVVISQCLQSLAPASDKFGLSISVVDNASHDNTLQLVEQAAGPVEITRLTDNLGYGHAINVGLTSMFAEDVSYAAVLIMNPDVTLVPGAIDKLANILFSSDKTGGVSPYLLEYGAEPGSRPRSTSLWGFSKRQSWPALKDTIEVDHFHGGCMLVKPALFKTIGLFDEAFFLYWEEVDLCLRARRAGYNFLICYGVALIHQSQSIRQTHRAYYMWRNQYYFSIKNYGKLLGTVFLARRAIGNCKELVSFLRAGRLDLIRAGLAGMRSGIAGATGRSSHACALPVPYRDPGRASRVRPWWSRRLASSLETAGQPGQDR